MDLEQSAAMVNRIESEFEERGFGLWVLERDGRFLGFTGLSAIPFASPIGSQVEIGWRLAQWAWGNGYVTEAAKAATRVGFEEHHLTQIFSFTTRTNVRSAAVMQRIGMKRRIDLDFEHPKTPGWWGQSHVVYQLTFDDWRESASGGLVT